jgi:hypothetical protein
MPPASLFAPLNLRRTGSGNATASPGTGIRGADWHRFYKFPKNPACTSRFMRDELLVATSSQADKNLCLLRLKS